MNVADFIWIFRPWQPRIFSDKVLEDIAGHQPLSPADLLEIRGVGPTLLEKYGNRILEIVAKR